MLYGDKNKMRDKKDVLKEKTGCRLSCQQVQSSASFLLRPMQSDKMAALEGYKTVTDCLFSPAGQHHQMYVKTIMLSSICHPNLNIFAFLKLKV